MNNLMSDSNFNSSTSWEPFKTGVGYHGKLFIDPESGVVLRIDTQAELKPTDFVHQEDMRIDYGAVTVAGKTYALPQTRFIFTEVAPYGENSTRRFSIRHTLLIMDYKDYKSAGQ